MKFNWFKLRPSSYSDFIFVDGKFILEDIEKVLNNSRNVIYILQCITRNVAAVEYYIQLVSFSAFLSCRALWYILESKAHPFQNGEKMTGLYSAAMAWAAFINHFRLVHVCSHGHGVFFMHTFEPSPLIRQTVCIYFPSQYLVKYFWQ